LPHNQRVRPLVVSHAACAGHAPENTLAGVRKAIELGAEAIEIDVQSSADGVPVLMHDLTVERTTTGTGAVAELSLQQLRSLDAGGEPVPTLAEVLDLTRGTVLLVIEIKQPAIAEDVARVVREAAALDEVMTWSFFAPALSGMRAAEPRIPSALLIAPQSVPEWPEMRRTALELGLQAVSVFFLGVNERIIQDCRTSGLALYTWTVDEMQQIKQIAGLGADGICSNYPDRVLSVLGPAGQPAG
jgi:glycerophosphoryl diester phosphodiesterase